KDRAQATLPAARAGEFARGRSMGMAAMLVMDMVVIVVVMMVVSVVIVTMRIVMMGDQSVPKGMVVVMMTGMIGVPGKRHRRRQTRHLQGADEAAALGPHQPGAEGCDHRVARDLDRLLGPTHGFGGGVQEPGAD